MAENGLFETQQLLLEAKNRWLRPAEICEVIRNLPKSDLATEPPHMLIGGSVFFYDRRVTRYFRNDGHNWRKKRDGKSVQEAHEKLKVQNIEVLHCFYAHGEENRNFQRRTYWMLELDFNHIAFVHYLEVKGKDTKITVENSPLSSCLPTNHALPGNTNSTSPLCVKVNKQQSSIVCSHVGFPQMENGRLMEKTDAWLSSSHLLSPYSDNDEVNSIPALEYISLTQGESHQVSDGGIFMIRSQKMQVLVSAGHDFEQFMAGSGTAPAHPLMPPIQHGAPGNFPEPENIPPGELHLEDEKSVEELPFQATNWQVIQIPCENGSLDLSKGPISVDQTPDLDLACDLGTRIFEQGTHIVNMQNGMEPYFAGSFQQNEQLVQNNIQMYSSSEHDMAVEQNSAYVLIVKNSLSDGEEGLKKLDSFTHWSTRELGGVDDFHVGSSSNIPWSTVECGNVPEDSLLNLLLLQDQLFSITDYSPKWAYTESKTEVHITGKFLKRSEEVLNCKWSCMFGEVEVPAEVLVDGILCCYAPCHNIARVPFYVTCSNRLACSQVRDFDYRDGPTEDVDSACIYGDSTVEMHLHQQLERLLSLRHYSPPSHLFEDASEKQQLINKIILLKEENECYQMKELATKKDLSQDEVEKQLLQELVKEKLYSWLIHRVTDSGKGPSILDADGQGVLHLAAALGYDWAIKPAVTAGVNINFRDVNGHTALHWAAFYGREQTVAVLDLLGADPGALTDPSPDFPLGRTPADLASGNGHKGISGFLAESSLTSYLSCLTVNDRKEDGAPEFSGAKVVWKTSERTATPVNEDVVPAELSLKDSLTAICNATQASDRIYQVFRMQSFQQRQLIDSSNNEFGTSDGLALSLAAARTCKPVNSAAANAAAIQVQKKFSGWKKMKLFLMFWQRIVKIQANVRGHQARKQYRKIIWSVGILEKVILRWRRKRSGLRGLHQDALARDFNPKCMALKEDDYDFLKEGRKQNEERRQIALSRVKSMIHYPEGRAQYRRMLTIVEGFRETKVSGMVLNNPKEMAANGDEDLVDIDLLMDDDTFMALAFN